MVASLAIGVLAPLPAVANSAQVKVTHAVHKESATKTTARSKAAKSQASKFRVGVMPAPQAAASSQSTKSSPKFIHR